MEEASCFSLIGGTCESPTEVLSTCTPHLSNLPISESISCICVSNSMYSVWKEVKFGLELNTLDIGLLFFQAFSVICSPKSWVSMSVTFIRSAPSFSPDVDRAKLSLVDLAAVAEDFSVFER